MFLKESNKAEGKLLSLLLLSCARSTMHIVVSAATSVLRTLKQTKKLSLFQSLLVTFQFVQERILFGLSCFGGLLPEPEFVFPSWISSF